MPARNTVKQYRTNAFYHVYNRGAGGRQIFLDDVDRRKFMSILQRHLVEPQREDSGPTYAVYEVELVAYCLMDNHFHMLLYQNEDIGAISGFMRSVITAYSMYFNLRHKDRGHLFQGIYKASYIDSDSYLLHISRYIHLNPRNYIRYEWSSLAVYLGEPSEIVRMERLPVMTREEYRQFLEDYTDRRLLLKEIKNQLAL